MKTIKIVLLGCALAWAGLHASDKDTAQLEALASGGKIWSGTPEDFAKAFSGMGFRWLSPAKEGAQRMIPGRVGNLRVGETVVRFSNGKLKGVTFSIYNRGDDGLINSEKFSEITEAWKTYLNEKTQVKPEERRNSRTSAVKADGLMWTTKDTLYLLEYSAQDKRKSEFKAEFVRLRLAPKPKGSMILNDPTKRTAVSRFALKDNIIKEENGDVYIKNVPMVDQGDKGYCVVASAERVFRYYGLAVDQHEMAQMANASADRGTNPDVMMDALKKVTGRMKLRVREHENVVEIRDLERLLKDYNRAAKKKGKREIPLVYGGVIDVGLIFRSFDGEVLKELRTSKRGFDGFKREVEHFINQGVPILWCVQIGLVPEPLVLPQTSGGHMRLIIGYNRKKDEIIYTDSWGAQHAKKNMPFENAYTMTTGYYTIQPTR